MTTKRRTCELVKSGNSYSCILKGSFVELYFYKGFFYDKLGWPRFPEVIFTRKVFY